MDSMFAWCVLYGHYVWFKDDLWTYMCHEDVLWIVCQTHVCFKALCGHYVDTKWTYGWLKDVLWPIWWILVCHKDILWTFVYFKNVLWIVCWTNLCLKVLCRDYCTWRLSCWYFGCFVDYILNYNVVWRCLVHLYTIYVYGFHVGQLLKFCKIFWINLLFFSRWEYHDMFGYKL
jgi:hypothetical protein